MYTDGSGVFGGFLLIVLVMGLVFGFVSSSIWSGKGGSSGAGFAIGFFLGVIGLVIVLVATPSPAVTISNPSGGARSIHNSMKRECPFCKEGIRGDASVCSHCQRESTPWTWNDNHWWKLETDGSWVWLDESHRQWKRAGEI